MNLLADIPIQPDFLFNSVGIIALGLFIAEKAQNVFGTKKEIPQPLHTKEIGEVVTWPVYEKDRDGFREEIKRVDEQHNLLAREVSDTAATLRANGVVLLQMDHKIDNLLRRP